MGDLSDLNHDRVIIVGAGPVGLVAALRLVRAGIPVVVLEAAGEPHAEPRASTFHPPTVDLLDELGLGARLVELGRPARTWQYCMFETGERAIFDLSVLENETNHPYRLQCEQLHLVKEAAKMLDAELSGALIFNAKALRVRQDEDGVAVDVEIEGTETTLQGRWLIGADGASSVVRKHLGLGFEGETYPTASVAIGTPFAFEKHIPDLCGVNYFWADGWSFSMFQTKDMWRVGYSPPPDMNAVAAVADDEIQMRLAHILPSIGPFEIITARLYSVHRRLVEKMRVGRMLLAGDAAHLNSPSGGFGMNGGVHDAFNLADKLIKVWGGGDDTLLDLYARQRHYAASADIQKTSDANHKRHREKDHGRRLETLKAMQETISDEKAVHNFLRESSLMNSLERANALT